MASRPMSALIKALSAIDEATSAEVMKKRFESVAGENSPLMNNPVMQRAKKLGKLEALREVSLDIIKTTLDPKMSEFARAEEALALLHEPEEIHKLIHACLQAEDFQTVQPMLEIILQTQARTQGKARTQGNARTQQNETTQEEGASA